MSNIFSKYQKELAGVKLIDSTEAFVFNPIPIKDTDLIRFSSIHKETIKNIPISNVKNIGIKKLKRRHHNYIQKYVKK